MIVNSHGSGGVDPQKAPSGPAGPNSSAYKSVLDFDQLNYLKAEGHIFRGFAEDPIHFPPTFKYDPGTNTFDTSHKQRVPSYTDRILYKAGIFLTRF